MRCVKESKAETARTFGVDAAMWAKAGRTVAAREYAITAAHFGRLAIEEAAALNQKEK